MRAVWRITQNADDADEAFQEASIQLLRRLPRLRVHPNPGALVLRICIDAAWDVVRRKIRTRRRERSLDAAIVDPTSRDGPVGVLDDERRQAVTAAIAKLPQQQAAAVAMRVLLACPYDEIAQALDCAEATARVHVARGLGRLRQLLAPIHPTHQENHR